MVSILHSLQLVNITICIICLVLPSTNGVDNKYKTCSSSLISCGNIIQDIGYPFWGEGRPQYCGHPALQLRCVSDEKYDGLMLNLGHGDKAPYTVLNVNYSPLEIAITLGEFAETPCSSYKKGFGELFQLSRPGVTNIRLLYNCSTDIHRAMQNFNSFTCYMSSTGYQAYYLGNKSAPEKYASCHSFEVLVFQSQLSDYDKGIRQLTEVVRQGFEVNYKFSKECIECRNLKGMCGSSFHTDFECIDKESAQSGNKKKLILVIGPFSKDKQDMVRSLKYN